MLCSCQLAAQTPRVLLVGDSWAQEQWEDGVHDLVFAANGFPDITVDGASTAINGTEAADWARPSDLQMIANALQNQSSIDTVQLTISGNDFLNAWNADMSDAEQDNLKLQIKADLQTVIDFILNQDPKIEIILSFYDHPNFVDTLSGLLGLVCAPLFLDLAQPTPLELNEAAQEFEMSYAQLANNNPRVFYVSHAGLMQFTYGFEDMGILPGDLLPPGDLSLPSPVVAMRERLSGEFDCFHLRPEGYQVIVQNIFDGYYSRRFDTLFSSGFE